MKHRTLVLVVLLLGVLVPSGLVAQSGGGPHPVVEIQKMKHDFGQIFEQKEYAHTFKVKNRGNADLVIEDVKPG